MSYDLNFWKYRSGVYLEHQSTYERLSNGEAVEGLEVLPIGDLIGALEREFSARPGWERTDEESWESESSGSFQIFQTPQFLRVDCYGMSGEDMNRIIDIAADFGCPLFDPQVGKRYDDWIPPHPQPA